MIIMLSPAKNMKNIEVFDRDLSLPCFIDNTKEIVENIKTFAIEDFKNKMKINEKLAVLNKNRFESIKFDRLGKPAILTYDGIQYKNIEAENFTRKDEEFANSCIRIISGLYGVVKPYDSIYEYRLEMQTKLRVGEFKNLYEYWGNRIYKELIKEKTAIVNLSSNEYSKSIEKFIKDSDTYITCTFKVNKNGILKVESTQAKKARGMMTKYIVKNRIRDIEELKKFNLEGYKYKENLSNNSEYIFVKE
ncbi:TPA: peroxide stress protein YaaA [Clostridioides difficile CD196]|nr:peroxide stress protein YaaA [Clostridioides difficile CD196]